VTVTRTSFGPGNRAAVTHGGWSPAVFGPVAIALRDALLQDRPRLAQYALAVAAWADIEARCLVLREHLDEHGMLDARGRVRPATELLVKLERRADQARQRLGLDPKADADLARATAEAAGSVADLDAVREAGRRALAARDGLEVVGVDREAPAGVGSLSDDRGRSDDA
jgi:hypothetical protein